MGPGLRNVLVIGGSYVGMNTAKELAHALPATHRVLLIDPHSHFNHLFVFPRFACLPDLEHKAFIPYSGVFATSPNNDQHAVIQAKVLSVKPKEVTIDREWQGSKRIPFDYLVAATGTRLAAPGTMPFDDKAQSVVYLKKYNQAIERAKRVVIIGGGAVGVQMACDLKEIYGSSKEVTLVHSRNHIMPVYDEKLSDMIKERFEDLGVKFVGGSRVLLEDYSIDTEPKEVRLQDGRSLGADFVITATGQIPNTQFLKDLESSSETSLINPKNGFIRVKPTMQFADPAYPHLFATGDVADSGCHKAARPAGQQAVAAAKNIAALIQGKSPAEEILVGPAAIHLTLGLTKNIIFRNPNMTEDQTEPSFNLKDDGRADMNIDGVWERRGVKVSDASQYHL